MSDNEQTLFLIIKREFFDQIASGEKTTEYRDYKKYYINKFKKPYTHLILQAGYSSTAPRIKVRIENIRLRKTIPPSKRGDPLFKAKLFYCLKINKM